MTDSEDARYSDEEAREILRRVTAMESRPALPTSAPARGVSLTELQEAARQAGIDPVAVRHAALARLPRPSRSLGTVIRGGPTLREHRIELPGHLPAERRASLAETLDRTFGAEGVLDPGRATPPGRRSGTSPEAPGVADAGSAPDPFRWSEDHTQGRTSVTVEAAPGGVSVVTVRADRRGWAAALNLVGLATGFGVGALALLPATGSALVAVVGSLAIWWGVVHPIWRTRSRRTADRLESAAVAVAAHLDEERTG
ncbi:MAG TPA: hypothetical protein VLL48_05600 [Longimicrobiales bacterium]|nr:hypothetical protein [Longimicrobiales bacterium]